VYVVEPSQVPELAARLGISTEPLAAALTDEPDDDPFAIFDPLEPDPGTEPELDPAQPMSLAEELADEPTEDPVAQPAALGAGPGWTAPSWNWPTPVPTGQPGTYRSYAAPPGIRPSFAWPPMPVPPAGSVSSH
jgi:hypothetical protein